MLLRIGDVTHIDVEYCLLLTIQIFDRLNILFSNETRQVKQRMQSNTHKRKIESLKNNLMQLTTKSVS